VSIPERDAFRIFQGLEIKKHSHASFSSMVPDSGRAQLSSLCYCLYVLYVCLLLFLKNCVVVVVVVVVIIIIIIIIIITITSF
jgi:hypothetical protein